uniref:RNA-editing substrate-binding complex 6 protein domain-containing protein n=1 Tax=Neospora caninum (strain Liverpool) TaxID=572307 RepID=A0A0F7UCT9_NEOCL|nr:TPA: hypothetical protein BN1204_026770 [Neospora caninum Liverpool]
MQPRHPLVKAVNQTTAPQLPAYLREFSLKQKDAKDLWKARAVASSPVHQAHATATLAARRPWAASASSGSVHPTHMDAPLVASTAADMARARSGNEALWTALERRALQLRLLFEPKEISLFLGALSRTRRFPPEVFKAFAPLAAQKIVYFNSTHLCMLLSAYAKSRVAPGPEFLSAVRQQLLHRLSLREIQSPVELAMLVNALVKLKLCEDRSLVESLAQHVRQRLSVEEFHVRELAVLAAAFAAVGYSDLALFSHIADAAVETINEATPVELARMLHAFSSVHAPLSPGECDGQAERWAQNERRRKQLEALLEVCVACAREKIAFMSVEELLLSANAVGQAFSVTASAALREDVAALLANMRCLAVASIAVFNLHQISSLLFSFSRWKQPFPPSDLLRVIDRLGALTSSDSCSSFVDRPRASTQVSILFFLNILLQSPSCAPCPAPSPAAPVPSKREKARHAARWLMHKWYPSIFAALASFDLPASCSSSSLSSTHAASGVEDRRARPPHDDGDTPESEAGPPDPGSREETGICGEMETSGRGMPPPAVQNLLRLLEAFVGLRDPEEKEEEHLFLRGLQEAVLRCHATIDSLAASQFLLLLEALRLPEEDDLVLVMKEKKRKT